jgi:NAD(P)-dependent dehydrogenase (short-subunit alcohol dehydrogenase family)
MMPRWGDGGVVVTGGARGIGLAVAERLRREGAQVVIADLPDDGLERAAARLGAVAVAADVGTEQGIHKILEESWTRLGRISTYVSNAGYPGGRGADAGDDVWAEAWAVNVMAHVRAVRELLPEWRARGEGRCVITASSAGLLTMVGNAPYSVSKHAAVAFAESMSITHGVQGVVFQVLCPQLVQTRMLDDTVGVTDAFPGEVILTPSEVAQVVWEAMGDDRFLILPHPEVHDYFRFRAEDTGRWIRGMRRFARRMAELDPEPGGE